MAEPQPTPATWHDDLARQIASPRGWAEGADRAGRPFRSRVIITRLPAGRFDALNYFACVNDAEFCGAPAGTLMFYGVVVFGPTPQGLMFFQASEPWNLPAHEAADFGAIPE